MSQLIAPNNAGGDTEAVIADKTRALAANQGLNDWDMWQKIDTEVASAATASKIIRNNGYKSGNTGDSHGNK